VTVHTAGLIYDGCRWSADGWVRVVDGRVTGSGVGTPPPGPEPVVRHAALLAGLTDRHARVTGYYSRITRGDALAPHRACLTLAAEAGVLSVVSVAGPAEAHDALLRSAVPGAPALAWTGPVLDGLPVTNVATRLVDDTDSARRAVAAVAADGAVQVATGPALEPGLVAEVVLAAAEYGLEVTHRPGRTDALEAARAGVRELQSLPDCLADRSVGRPAERTAASLVRFLGQPQVRRGALERLRVLAEHGTAVVPLVHAARRAALLVEAVAEPRLDRLLPMAPFHQYLIDMRGPGMVFGRRYARDQFGYEHLSGSARREFDTGWAALLECLAAAHDLGVGLRPGSGALGLALVPGYALLDELAWWEAAGLPRHTVLGAAAQPRSPAPAGTAYQSPWRTGVLALSCLPEQLASLAALPAAASVVAPAVPRTSLPHPEEMYR
jgi:hypothetical protein